METLRSSNCRRLRTFPDLTALEQQSERARWHCLTICIGVFLLLSFTLIFSRLLSQMSLDKDV